MSVHVTRPSPRIPALALAPNLESSVLVLCGVVASGAFAWEGLLPLRVVAAWLAADAALGCVLSQLIALKLTQARYASTRDPEVTPSGPVRIPYAAPGSPGHRLASTINHYIADWEEFTWPELGRRGLSAWVATALALVLGTYLGRWELGLLSGTLVLAGLATLILGRNTQGLERLLLALQATLAVTLGYLIVAPLNWLAACLAAMAAIWAYSEATWRQTGASSAVYSAGLAYAGAVGLLLWARQPVPAAAIAILGISQVLGAREGLEPRRIHLHRLAWLSSLLLLSFAATYWSWPA